MHRMRLPVSLLTASIAAILGVPAPALAAATSVSLTKAQINAALTEVAASSAKASSAGWRGVEIRTDADGYHPGKTITSIDDVTGDAVGRIVERFKSPKWSSLTYAKTGKGTYEQVYDKRAKAVLKMMHRPGVTHILRSDKTLTVDKYLENTFSAPGHVNAAFLSDGARTIHTDGSVDYTVTYTDPPQMFTPAGGARTVLHINADGVLTSVDITGPDIRTHLTYTYGRQTVTLPATSKTISLEQLQLGSEYLDMSSIDRYIKHVATEGATATRKAADGARIDVADLRTIMRRTATADNADTRMNIVKVRNVAGGMRVYATNPWTKATRAYTVKASGTKVTVTRN